MRVFISYHRKDEKYRDKLCKILDQNNIDHYVVPKEISFKGFSHEQIKQNLVNKMMGCDVVICIVGIETYRRPHVDHELNAALFGGPKRRKGLIALILEERRDTKGKLTKRTLPTRIKDNSNYIIIEKFGSFYTRVNQLIIDAKNKSNDYTIEVKNNQSLKELRKGRYE